jgi:hypothetical protein
MHIAPPRMRTRLRVFAAIATLAAAGVVLTATPASAYTPQISARTECAADGSILVTFTATTWFNTTPDGRENPDIRINAIVDNGVPVEMASGAFVAPDFSFSGQFNVPSGITSLSVNVYAAGTWSDGTAGGQTGNFGKLIVPVGCQPPGDEGCTPGYWKNHPEAWAGTGYATGQTAGSVFTIPGSLGLSSTSLLATLNGGGGSGTLGGAKILLRAGTAAVLNAASGGVDYTQSVAEVIADVNAALASGDRDTMLSVAAALDSDNNLGCPLS